MSLITLAGRTGREIADEMGLSVDYIDAEGDDRSWIDNSGFHVTKIYRSDEDRAIEGQLDGEQIQELRVRERFNAVRDGAEAEVSHLPRRTRTREAWGVVSVGVVEEFRSSVLPQLRTPGERLEALARLRGLGIQIRLEDDELFGPKRAKRATKPETPKRRRNRGRKPTAVTATGTLRVHRRGFGFVDGAAGTDAKTVFVPPTLVGQARTGDTVEVTVSTGAGGRPAATAMTVIERVRPQRNRRSRPAVKAEAKVEATANTETPATTPKRRRNRRRRASKATAPAAV